MLFKPLERAARMADAEIRKSRKKTSYNKVISQENTKEWKDMTDKEQGIVIVAIIICLAVFVYCFTLL